ncbi:MAG: cytochrome c oxidase subunit 3 [Bacteroidetes bacterium]|nr:cytochrome c oxidase subunit 3 [Bacteroidota bacterium]
MNYSVDSVDSTESPGFKVDPVKFTLWVFLVSVAMLFAAFTSGYIVRKAKGDWVDFDLPPVFLYSCLAAVMASIAMYMAQRGQKTVKKRLTQIGLGFSLAFGLLFMYLQWEGWRQLTEQGIYLVGNASGSFLYVISGVHAVHFIVGLLIIVIALIRSFILDNKGLAQQRLSSVATYWHFVGVLWIYLYLFFNLA